VVNGDIATGTANTTAGTAIDAAGDARVTLNGSASGQLGIFASGQGTKIMVTGNVTAISGEGAYAGLGGEIVVAGNVTSNGCGVKLRNSGPVIIEGYIAAPEFSRINGVLYSGDDFAEVTTREGYNTYTDGTSTVWVKYRVPSGIAGPTALALTAGYAATSTGVYTVTGDPAPTVTKTAGDAKITWNNSTKKLDIAAGLGVGTYPVTLTANNGVSSNATASFTLTVSAVQVTNYTVTYNTDGGTSAAIAPVTVASGTTISLPSAPAKSGNIFKGWSNGSTTLNAGASYTVTGNVTFTAQWAKTIFSTKYEATFLNWILFFVCFGFIWMWF